MTYNLYFTLDYEIHGNGDGNSYDLMVEPTYRLMTLLEQYHQKLTIMADVAEILCFKRYRQETGRDDYHVQDIETQLREAVRRGHDVQLHVHSSYFKAKHNGTHFDQCIEEYNMAALPIERIREMVSVSVRYLEDLLRPVNPDYKVWLFRAANWSMMPTPDLYRVLVENGITHDTSVYKGGCQGGNVCYDYRTAYSSLFPYKASARDINHMDSQSALTEWPIYTEMRPFYDFVSPIRIFRMLRAKRHKHKQSRKPSAPVVSAPDNRKLSLHSFFTLSPLKMDFNQVSSRGLIRMMKHILATPVPKDLREGQSLPVVLIGHSKTFIPYNERTLRPFLQWLAKKNIIR